MAHNTTERRTLRLTQAEAAALTQAADEKHLTENSYLRRALQTALRLDAFAEEPTAYQTWLRDGLSDLFAAANASAVLSHVILSRLLASSDDASREEMDHLLAIARESLPGLDTAIPWHSAADIEGPEYTEFWSQVQGQRRKRRKRKKG